MKTIQLDDKTLPALRMSVEIQYDMHGDMLFDELPTTVREIREMSSKSDEELKAELKLARDDFNAKLDLMEGLAILKHQLKSL